MCGIAGDIRWNAQPDENEVKKMVHRLQHRGPDDSGLWRSADKHCVLGHTRLSIIDLSDGGHQPMFDPLTKNAIVFNGEIYNYLDLRKECLQAGERFHSDSDTEVILALYRIHGIHCLSKLRGMFAFGIWDPKQQHLFLARDRVGKKPLNYALLDNGIVFSSELDAITHHKDVSGSIDNSALELYLQLQFIPAPWSIYKEVRKLPPASYAIYRRDGLKIQQYWDVNYKSKIKISEADAIDALEEKVKEAIKIRMRADVPLGALLSGGVDSSLVVALMSGMTSRPVKTFSIGFNESKHSELPYAKAVAEQYGTDHHPKVLHGDIGPHMENLIRHYGEPFADSSAIPSFFVCRTAQAGVTVAMNGDGGDELLGGYPRYWLKPQTITLGDLIARNHSSDKLAKLVSGLPEASSILARARRKWLLRFSNPELQSMMVCAAFWNDTERRQLLGRETSVLHEWRRNWLEGGYASANNPIDQMLWIDNRTYLAGDLLVKMDIASMHCGLEARSPLLDHKLIEFCASLPVNLKVHQSTGKYLLKKLAERNLPCDLIYRKKMGFGIPLSEWLSGTLRTLTEDILLDSTIMSPFDQSVIQRILKEFFMGKIDHSSRIWALLMFGLWHRYSLNARTL